LLNTSIFLCCNLLQILLFSSTQEWFIIAKYDSASSIPHVISIWSILNCSASNKNEIIFSFLFLLYQHSFSRPAGVLGKANILDVHLHCSCSCVGSRALIKLIRSWFSQLCSTKHCINVICMYELLIKNRVSIFDWFMFFTQMCDCVFVFSYCHR
jgi:hypothetical protein